MRIAYGVHGYGHGHAMRALAVLPLLEQRHEIVVLAGGEAFQSLRGLYRVERIPSFEFHYNRRGRISNTLTARRNLSATLDLRLGGPSLRMVMKAIEEFSADVVVTDSEGFTHRAAQRLFIPRISFDHFGLLVYFRPAREPIAHEQPMMSTGNVSPP